MKNNQNKKKSLSQLLAKIWSKLSSKLRKAIFSNRKLKII